ncbi:MAG: winged helix-turn-helix transcriptional regulator, partial [Tissierellia bacterium]|nr:winged helix-turn-helix transcriptional regulator [Tissierellia bacterium]
KQVTIYKALSDGNRLQIIKMLKDGERCACQMLEDLNITQPTLSHHMKVLIAADLVNVRKDGKWMHYSRQQDTFRQLAEEI